MALSPYTLVAEWEGQVVGHIAFSPAFIHGEGLGWYTLSPVAVLPSRQKQGIGAPLIRTGLDGLRALGAGSCLLVGDPAYQVRFGFRQVPRLRIHEVPPEYVMCLPFSGDIPSGLVTHHPAFFTTA
nr:N-acetyltransferase [Geothrix terrae]